MDGAARTAGVAGNVPGVSWTARRADLLRTVARHRRLLAAGLAAGAVAAGLTAVTPPGVPGVPVLMTTRTVPAGGVLEPADVTTRPLPAEAVPDGAVTRLAEATGRVLAAPARRGEVLTSSRFVGPDLLVGTSGMVASPLRLADPGSAALLAPGDRVDVLAAETELTGRTATVGPARLVAPAVRVLAVNPGSDPQLDGGLVLVAVSPAQAAHLARAAVTARLSVTLRPR